MPETGKNQTTNGHRLTIRVGSGSLSFSLACPETEKLVAYEPYDVNNGISMAANLREALKTLPFALEHRRRALVLLDTPVVFVPTDEFTEDTKKLIYTHTLTGQEGNAVLHSVLPALNAVAVYAVNRDLKLVIEDNFEDFKFSHTCIAVINRMYKHNFTGTGRKLFCHFNGHNINVYSFLQKRFKFANSYDAESTRDAIYFIMHVWQQLALNQQKDDLHIVGDVRERDMLTKELGKYIRNVCMINRNAEFNRSPIASIEGMPYDLVAHFMK